MIFFRLTLSPVDIPVSAAPSPEVHGVVFAPVDNIEAASPLVVKGLFAAGWRIVKVIEARLIRERDTLLLDKKIAALHAQAEQHGFAYSVEEAATSAASPTFENSSASPSATSAGGVLKSRLTGA